MKRKRFSLLHDKVEVVLTLIIINVHTKYANVSKKFGTTSQLFIVDYTKKCRIF